MIASQQMVGMQAAHYTMSDTQREHFAKQALGCTDELIKQAGFYVVESLPLSTCLAHDMD